MIPSSLPPRWRDRAAELERYAPAAAEAFKAAAQELEDALHDQEMEVLTLEAAHELGGYSAEHLAREIREGRIPNAGRKGAPRILRKDVPVKAGHGQRESGSLRSAGASSSGARARRAALSLERRR